jgi:pimeloyl-ACP methyl ester carboxylesterase
MPLARLTLAIACSLTLGWSSSSCAAKSVAPAAIHAPWSAQATTIVQTEEKTVRSAGTTLQGTLYLPPDGRSFAAVVVTHAASSPLRISPLYEHLKEMLPTLGIAVFVYDRRGSGRSGGNSETSDFDLLADDAVAAVRMLKADPRIDPKRVGIWGLSQGGWLSLLAAARSADVDFTVSISAPVVTPDVQMMFSSENSLRVNGYSQADIDQMRSTRKALDDYMRGTGDRAMAQRMVDAAKVKPWFKYLYMADIVGDRATSRWRKEIEHDPLATLKAVKVPSLVIYGAADPVVPVAASIERLKPLELPMTDVVVIAGADHGMQTAVDPKDLLDPAHADVEKPDSPAYFAVLASWLTVHGLTQGIKPR